MSWEDEAAAPVIPESPPPEPLWETEPEPSTPVRRRARRLRSASPLLGPDDPVQFILWARKSVQPVEPPEVEPPPEWLKEVVLRPSRFLAFTKRLKPYASVAVWTFAISVLVLGTAVSYQSRQRERAAEQAAAANAPAKAAAAAPKVVTQAMYDQIHKGMTEADATVLFGRGELMAVGLHGGAVRRVLRWPGDGKEGSTVYIAFEDGKAIGRGRNDRTVELFK